MVFSFLDSPVGSLVLVADEKYVHGLIYFSRWSEMKKSFPLAVEGSNGLIESAKEQLQEYFSGIRKVFTLPLSQEGTKFQSAAWSVLQKIPYGETISYGEQAKRMRNPKAVRAVGGANGANFLSIFIPCHRVIGKDGSITGYGGGIKNKNYLLNLERSYSPQRP